MDTGSYLIVGVKNGEKLARKLIQDQRKGFRGCALLATAALIFLAVEHLRVNQLEEKINYLIRTTKEREPKGE